MPQIQVKFYVKERDNWVNYHFGNPILISNDKITINNVNFHLPTLLEEVKQSNKHRLKKYKRTLQAFVAATSTFILSPLRSMANTSISVNATATTTLPQIVEGMPPELLKLLLTLLMIAVGAAVILAAIFLVSAGIMRMLRKRKESTEWIVDIIWGLITSLIAVPLVFLIYFFATTIFKNSGWFVSPF